MGGYKYYFKSDYGENFWTCNDEIDLPTHSVKEFLTQEKQIMKVTDLKENECIHCETEEQANAICKLMHDACLTWNNGDSYLSENNYFVYKSETCYFSTCGQYADLEYAKENNYKIYKAKQFLTQKTKIMSTIVNINPDTSEINITPQEGFEIDVENSDLKNGKVILKEVEKKYPSEFNYSIERHGKTIYAHLSEKYANKISILDTLLCLRDEYNRIDGFTDGFRFGEKNWCISYINNELIIDEWRTNNKLMHFGKEETAERFLKNFKEQLETVKEFL